ncbi:MAG: lactonase family protein [Chloroflexota bacterium]
MVVAPLLFAFAAGPAAAQASDATNGPGGLQGNQQIGDSSNNQQGDSANGPGVVYAMTNELTGNRIQAYDRSSNGSLTPAGTFSTGGMGSGKFEGSQNSLILRQNSRLLFAVNPGSNDISVLTTGPNGLTLVSKTPSGGMDPTSLTLHANLLYVLNAGGVPNISGFTVAGDGTLTPLAGSTRPLTGTTAAALPAEVGFDKSGSALVVTERNTGIIDTYTVGSDGLASGPLANRSNGDEPFGFAFTTHGRNGQLIVTEAHRGLLDQGTVSSYTVAANGALQTISASVHDFQSDTCWVVITNNQRYAYMANLAGGTVSSYTIAPDGTLTLLQSVAGVDGPPASGSIDDALSANSDFLYVRNITEGTISVYAVQADGSLTPMQTVAGLPPSAIGIVAR